MKKLLLIAVAIGLSFPLLAQTNFRSLSFSEAMDAARQEKKLVFIDFYTDWCGPCKKMARETFPQKNVGNFMNQNFVCLKLNAEKEGKELAARYAVKAYPTFIILDSDGKVRSELKGAMDGDAFIAKLKAGLDPEQTPERMAERYQAGERTPELVNNYALHMMEQRKEKEGFEIVNNYFESLSEAERLKEVNAFLFTRYTLNIDDAKARFMVAHRDEFDATVKEEIAERVARLYRAKLIMYFSGYQLRSNLYKEEEYQMLKNEICSLGLDKEYKYAPMFRLIEGRLICNDEAYVDMCVKEYDGLEEADRSLLIMNLTRLIQTDDVAILKRMSEFIRNHLREMVPSCISVASRALEDIESRMNKK